MSQLLKLFDFTSKELRALAAEQAVADAPIVVGDVTIIPISKVSCGLSYGGSDLDAKKNAGGLKAGVGAKVSRTPLQFIAIRGEEVQLLSVPEDEAKKKGLMDTIKPLLEKLKKPKDKGEKSEK